MSISKHWYRSIYLKSDHWMDLRAEKLSEYPFCQRCTSKKTPDVHHLNYRNLYDCTTGDLLTVCRMCHDSIHAELDRRLWAVDTAALKRLELRFQAGREQWKSMWQKRRDEFEAKHKPIKKPPEKEIKAMILKRRAKQQLKRKSKIAAEIKRNWSTPPLRPPAS